jgi:uncharacterized protein
MAERVDVRFPSAGVECSAWLYLPEGGPAPVIVMAHGLGGVRGMRLDAYAERFCAAGYACLVFDYRHFGDSDGQPRQLLDIGRQLDDWAAAIAYARSLKTVGRSRVVLWGTSFGGGHVIVAAARDRNIAAVVSQCPFTDGPASVLAMSPWTSAKVTAVALRDVIGARFGQDPVMIATSGPPRSTALMAAPDAQPGYLALAPATAPFSNQVAARIALGITTHVPGRKPPTWTARFCSACARPTASPRPKRHCATPAKPPAGRSSSIPKAISTSTSQTLSSASSPTRSDS